MTNTSKAYVAITVQSLIIGLSFLMVKVTLNTVGTIELLAHRFTIAAIGVLLYKAIRPQSISLPFRDLLKIVPFSLAYPICFFLFQTIGLQSISSSEAGVISAITPILTLMIAHAVLGESITGKQKVLMLLSVSGIIFINLMNGIQMENYSYWGFLFILLSALSFSVYTVLARKLSTQYSVFTIVYVMSIVGCVVFNAISIGQHLMDGEIQSYFEPFTNLSFVLSILYLGFLSSLITSILSTYALSRLEATKVGLFSNFSTVISILAGTVFLQEPLFYYHTIGIAAVLIGAIGFNLSKSPKKE